MIIALIRTMRPHQWAKNLLLFAPLLFAKKLFQWESFLSISLGFILFCLLAGSVYILNDLLDFEKDRQHPKKRHRPIASGELSKEIARKTWIFLAIFALLASFALDLLFGVIALSYLLLNLAYSFRLKKIAYLDVLIVATGFLLRVLGGIEILHVSISTWILPCTFLLSLYLALGKRRHELSAHGEKALSQREVMKHYDIERTNLLLSIVAGLTVLAYCGYIIDPMTLKKFHTPYLIFTLPFVAFGIVRFLQLIEKGASTESPTQELLKDIPSLVNVVLWVAAVIYIIYFQPGKSLLQCAIKCADW